MYYSGCCFKTYLGATHLVKDLDFDPQKNRIECNHPLYMCTIFVSHINVFLGQSLTLLHLYVSYRLNLLHSYENISLYCFVIYMLFFYKQNVYKHTEAQNSKKLSIF